MSGGAQFDKGLMYMFDLLLFRDPYILAHLYRQNNRIIQLRQEEKSSKHTHIGYVVHPLENYIFLCCFSFCLHFLLFCVWLLCVLLECVTLSPEQINCSKAHQKRYVEPFYLCTHSLVPWQKTKIWNVQTKIIVL